MPAIVVCVIFLVLRKRRVLLLEIVVMLLDGYYHLCQAILCTVRIVSRRVSF